MNKESQTALVGVYRLSAIITIVLFTYLISFIYKLEVTGCECVKDWRRNYIVAYCLFIIVHSCIMLFTNRADILYALTPLTLGLGLLFVVFTLQYVHRLKNEKCNCSDSIGSAILYIVAAIDGAVFALYGLIILAGALVIAFKGH